MVGMLAKKVLAAGLDSTYGARGRSKELRTGSTICSGAGQSCPGLPNPQHTQRGQARRRVLAASQRLARRLRQRRRGTGVCNNRNRPNQRCFALGTSTTVLDNGLGWGSGSRASTWEIGWLPQHGLPPWNARCCRGGVESAGTSKQETTVKAPGSGLVGVQASRVEFGIKSQVKSW